MSSFCQPSVLSVLLYTSSFFQIWVFFFIRIHYSTFFIIYLPIVCFTLESLYMLRKIIETITLGSLWTNLRNTTSFAWLTTGIMKGRVGTTSATGCGVTLTLAQINESQGVSILTLYHLSKALAVITIYIIP